MRDIAVTAGTSVNDVFLTALSLAFRALRSHDGGRRTDISPLSALMPMSVRKEDQTFTPGNLLVGKRVLLPCHVQAPGRALEMVHEQTTTSARSGQRDLLRGILTGIPSGYGERLVRRVATPRAAQIIASNVTIPGELSPFGGKVVGTAMFSTVPREIPCYVSLTGHTGTRRLTVVHERDFEACGALPALWLEGLSRLSQAVGIRDPDTDQALGGA
ncbi:hypothetical protein [Streptomyces sp. NPDC047999]|uniref:hypothetical protein n=1 Tax=Streptomyces sp. NPDC047999 TaxID=3365497 RepID=UPI0037248771